MSRRSLAYRDKGFSGLLRAVLLLHAYLAIAAPPGPQGAARAEGRPASENKDRECEEEIRKYRAVVEKFPSSSQAIFDLGSKLASCGSCQEAAEEFSKLRNSKQGLGKRKALVGICHFRLREYPQAVSQLQEAARLDPHSKVSVIFLARSYAASGHYREGIRTIKSWTAQNGDDVDALYWTGKFYEELSTQAIERMIDKNSNHYLVHEIQGDEYVYRQEYEKALEEYRQALAAAPTAPGLHFALGDVYRRTLNFPEAKQELEKELKLNPYHAQANYELGDIAIRQGNLEEGIHYLGRARALNPQLIEARRSLGRAFVLKKDYDAALREFSIVAQADPSDHTIHALLANTYRLMGRLKDAEEESHKDEKLMNEGMEKLQRLKAQEQVPSSPVPKN